MEQLGPDDLAALGWAWTTRSPTGRLLRDRQARGESPAPTAADLRSILDEWGAAGRPPAEMHAHRTAIELPDGTVVTAVSFLADDPYGRAGPPAFGLYLDARWDPPWSHAHLDWPDFGIPDPDQLRAALADLLARARRGDAVEVGCLGGHGRTGTALACLAVLTGAPPSTAVAWVREQYCGEAVENPGQQAFVERFTA